MTDGTVPQFDDFPRIRTIDPLLDFEWGYSCSLANFPPSPPLTQDAPRPVRLRTSPEQPVAADASSSTEAEQSNPNISESDLNNPYDHSIYPTAITYSIQKYKLGRVSLYNFKLLIRRYCSHTRNPDIDRILRYAVLFSALSYARYLVDFETARLDQDDILGRSAIFYATHADLDTFKYVISDPSFENNHLVKKDKSSSTPFHYAVKRDAEYVELLLSKATSPIIQAQNTALVVKALSSGRDTTLNKAIWQNLNFKKLVKSYPHISFSVTFCHPVHSPDQTCQIQEIKDLPNAIKDLPNASTIWRLYGQGQRIWVHVPATNGILLGALIKSSQELIQTQLLESGLSKGCLLDFFLGSFESPSTTPGDPLLDYRDSSCELRIWNLVATDWWDCFTIVFPCLVLVSIEDKENRRKNFEDMKKNISGGSCYYNVHTERTLDEAYFPGLNKAFLAGENEDQVVSREYRKKLELESKDKSLPIIMVPQLWICSVHDFMFSAFLQPLSETKNTKIDRNELPKPNSNGLRIGLIIAEQIDRFGQPQKNTNFAPPLDYFEMGVVRILSEVKEYVRKDNLKKISINKENDFLHEIADIRNELVMIKDVLDQQRDVLERLIEYYVDNTTSDDNIEVQPVKRTFNSGDWKEVADAKKRLERYGKRVRKIDDDAERIDKIIQNQLNLKRTYSSIRDTSTSLFLSTAVIGFTVITVIFTPLAFMTSLFALPLEQLMKHQKGVGDDRYYETQYVKYWFGAAEGASLAVTVIAVVVSLIIVKWDGTWWSAIKRYMSDIKHFMSHINYFVWGIKYIVWQLIKQYIWLRIKAWVWKTENGKKDDVVHDDIRAKGAADVEQGVPTPS